MVDRYIIPSKLLVIWLGRQYSRLSISKLKPEFVGWDCYVELLEQIPHLKSSDPERDQAFFAIMFEAGCRIREVLGKKNKNHQYVSPPLKRSNFLFTKVNRLIITDIPILKRYEKIDYQILQEDNIPDNTSPALRKLWHKTKDGKFERKIWKTKRQHHTRRVEIPLDEPLLDYAIPYIKKCDGVLFDLSYDYYYAMCRRMDPLKGKYPKVPEHIFPHWWRSQRACQLASEYGFTLHELLEFFDWQDIRIAKIYASLAGALGDKMSKIRTTWRGGELKSTTEKTEHKIKRKSTKKSKIKEQRKTKSTPTTDSNDDDLAEFEKQMEEEGLL
jgi:hypothetical protein